MLSALRTRLRSLEGDAFLKLSAVANGRVAERARRHNRQPRPAHLLTGERGEDLAFFHLREKGYTIVARRWRSPRSKGDLDLVGWDGETLVIFEVKTRTARDLAPAATAVDAPKRRTLGRLATLYRQQLPQPWRDLVTTRMDILSVYDLPEGTAFEHVADAFPLAPRTR